MLPGQGFTQGYCETCGAWGQSVCCWEVEVQHSSGGINVLGAAGTAKLLNEASVMTQ